MLLIWAFGKTGFYPQASLPGFLPAVDAQLRLRQQRHPFTPQALAMVLKSLAHLKYRRAGC